MCQVEPRRGEPSAKRTFLKFCISSGQKFSVFPGDLGCFSCSGEGRGRLNLSEERRMAELCSRCKGREYGPGVRGVSGGDGR